MESAWPDVLRRDEMVWGALPEDGDAVRRSLLEDGYLRVFACTWNMQGLVCGAGGGVGMEWWGLGAL